MRLYVWVSVQYGSECVSGAVTSPFTVYNVCVMRVVVFGLVVEGAV